MNKPALKPRSVGVCVERDDTDYVERVLNAGRILPPGEYFIQRAIVLDCGAQISKRTIAG